MCTQPLEISQYNTYPSHEDIKLNASQKRGQSASDGVSLASFLRLCGTNTLASHFLSAHTLRRKARAGIHGLEEHRAVVRSCASRRSRYKMFRRRSLTEHGDVPGRLRRS